MNDELAAEADVTESGRTEEHAVPVIEEELVTGTQPVQTGSVRIRKEVARTKKTVEMPTLRDVVKVSRVAVNKVVSAIPDTRQEGDILIVPVVEEEIIVQKRLVLKEEIHIQRRRISERTTKTIVVGREEATVERLDAEGRVIATSKPGRER